jgi:hypothetical protein
MPRHPTNVDPRNFFLNEQHELPRGEKEGGGRVPEFVGVNWGTKGSRISHSLLHVRDVVKRSQDPLRASRYFVLARPTANLEDPRLAGVATAVEHDRVPPGFQSKTMKSCRAEIDSRADAKIPRNRLQDLNQASDFQRWGKPVYLSAHITFTGRTFPDQN